MARILFSGGPCDGVHTDYDDTQVTSGLTTCKGFVYVVYTLPEGEYIGLVPGARPVPESHPVEQTGAGVPDEALAAWSDFNRRVGHGVAAHVNATAQIRRGIRNTVR